MRRFLLATASVALIAMPAHAAIVDFTNITGEWFNPVSGYNIAYIGNATDTASINWSNPLRPAANPNTSGYTFEAAVDPSLTVVAPANSDEVTIGYFTHHNNPIRLPGLDEVSLKFNTDVYVDGAYLTNVTFIYDFVHLETRNASNPCGNGEANNQGVNINGCADNVRINFNDQSEFFTLVEDGVSHEYALDIQGFLLSDGSMASSFWTIENMDNTAEIRARLVRYSELVPGVPEPASWALMIAGFGLVGMAVRRRKGIVSLTA